MSVPAFTPGISSFITSVNIDSVDCSNPFEHTIIGCFSTSTNCLYCFTISLVNFDGVTCNIKSEFFITSS